MKNDLTGSTALVGSQQGGHPPICQFEGWETMTKLSKKTQMTTGGPVFVYVDEEKDKIVRMTPMDLDDSDAESWKLKRGDALFSPRERPLTRLIPRGSSQ